MKRTEYTESSLVEEPAISLFQKLGWQSADCFHERFMIRPRSSSSEIGAEAQSGISLGRQTKAEVVLVSRLRPALERLNPDLPPEAFDQAIEELTRDRSRLSLAGANREVFDLIKNGIRVRTTDPEGGGEIVETVQVIDWQNSANNDFFLGSQFWVSGEMYTRRADLVGFVNGLPLLFIELKASHKRLETAFTNNLRDYKHSIPHLFWYNAFIILSNGSESRIGSATALWEHFNEWKKITSEGEEGRVSLETMIRGTCERGRFLDLVENFILFMEAKGGAVKLVAKNHQFLGVTACMETLEDIKNREGRLGVFWHTQGSGKSVSMIFFAQKVLRRNPGNWTFVIITDRKELDDQIYKTFASAGAVTESKAHATSSAHLRRLLSEDHRYVFTIIHKFRTPAGEQHPVLSDRDDIIVITDEAHRSQYDTLAMNMRTALPNASFLAFTGTPLIAGEEKTRHVFGDYVSIYDFKQSVVDDATVALYYENRIPELQLTNEDLNEDMEHLLDEVMLDEEQERKLEREFSRQYHLIIRDDRLEAVAEDIVDHFMGRGFQGKAMVVCIDKATALRMYDKVQKHWKRYLYRLEEDVASSPLAEAAAAAERVQYMKETDMAVVVSEAQNETEDMQARDLDIVPHRKRMKIEDLDTKFKDPDDPFRIVFVCAMWMTGFDVPCCSTIYLDKPMRNHTLMQTIARANRVFPEKNNGLIVDYVGIFRDLERALAIYGSGYGEAVRPGELPVRDKRELVEELRRSLAEVERFCDQCGIALGAIHASEGFERIRLLDNAIDTILVTDDSKRRFLSLANDITRLYKAILPDPAANEITGDYLLINVLAEKIRNLTPVPDISAVMGQVEELLDESIATEGYVIRERAEPYGDDHIVDLSAVDFEALRAKFQESRKHIETEKLKGAINNKLKTLVRMNRTRIDFLDQFQRMIDEYNAGSMNIEEFFEQLVTLSQSLTEEESRAIREELSEEELAVFDILTKPEMDMTKAERQQVKLAARELLETLKREKLVIDWRKRQQSRAQVLVTIESILDQHLPAVFAADLFQQKCDAIFQHIYESYQGAGRSKYS